MRKSVYSEGQARLQALLTAARKRTRLTKQEVADRLDKPQSFVAKYEGGERRLDVVEFVAVARAIGADPKRLVAKLVADAKLQQRRGTRKVN